MRDTFAALGDEYVAKLKRESRAPTTLGKVEWLLGLAKDAIGERPIREITAAEVLTVLRKAEARGVHERIACDPAIDHRRRVR